MCNATSRFCEAVGVLRGVKQPSPPTSNDRSLPLMASQLMSNNTTLVECEDDCMQRADFLSNAAAGQVPPVHQARSPLVARSSSQKIPPWRAQMQLERGLGQSISDVKG